MPKWQLKWLWNFVKSKLGNEGALNKIYDSQLRGIVDNADFANNADTVDGYHADAFEKVANKGIAGGYCPLDANALVPLANIPALPSSKLGFGLAWELVGEISVSADVQSVTFSGLDSSVDKVYMLIGYWYNSDTVNDRTLWLQFNGDTNVADYGWNSWQNKQGTVSTSYQSIGGTTGVAAVPVATCNYVGLTSFVTFIIHNFYRTAHRVFSFGGHQIYTFLHSGNWDYNAAITSITVVQIAGAYIGAGSRFLLFKLANV